MKSVAIVGGGFSGALLAVKLLRERQDLQVRLIEAGRRIGVGLAYGACSETHLLNVPAQRMDVGLHPSFVDWLGDLNGWRERDADLADAFAPRAAFGRYLEAQFHRAAATHAARLEIFRGEAVRFSDSQRGVVLRDGRIVEADFVVLATGNAPPARPPALPGADTAFFTPDPWSAEAIEGLKPADPVLLLGSGLTMIDIALRIAQSGHVGDIIALSRRGFLPTRHAEGGAWPRVFSNAQTPSPRGAMRAIRAAAQVAANAGAPWQRVIDAVRPDVARLWRSWSPRQKRQFLRHARVAWDVHRHRMPADVSAAVDALMAEGRLSVMSGTLLDAYVSAGEFNAVVRPRGEQRPVHLRVARIVNCTGPRSDLRSDETPLFADLRRRGWISPDALGLGLETMDCALLNADGAPSSWLYAVGPLTRPALWEVTAVPEIRAQIDHLAHEIARADAGAAPRSLAEAFADLGAGI